MIAIGFLFAVGMSLGHLLPVGSAPLRSIATAAFIFLIFGTFVGVVLVTEENQKYASSGAWLRVASGAVALAAIAVLLSAPWSVVGFAALVGVMLGYAGIYWVKHI
ncbi:hypothetical protein [Aquabacterium sp. J223]|uniref:hypothetical protein n=1 Tax=Aquabacterium sp. J223 TaxID=2898431 RepID=UPI0021AD9277|nr:hypothetical protein [Aquabacterium sp. J223]UUX94946.1 hypothetical protein LRS07_17095 [Aquabacterium sp. J223]